MNVHPTPLAGVLQIEIKVFADSRGHFCETWSEQRYAAAGIDEKFVQDNLSWSRHRVIRGLHFQNPKPQAKLVSVLQGGIYDVVVDLRQDSPTFKQWFGITLSDTNRMQLFIPPGFAHGFQVLNDVAVFSYKCSDFYHPPGEVTLRWDDPEIGVKWPLANPVLSAKDQAGLLLKDIPSERLFPRSA